MHKRVAKQIDTFIYKGESTKITLGTLIIVLFSVILIIVSTFTQLNIVHPVIPLDFYKYFGKDLTDPAIAEHFIRHYRYIPQVPLIFFIVGILGRRFAVLSVLIYIFVGLFLYPVYAMGGGISYILEYGFGFILAYLPAVYYAGTILTRGYNLKSIFHAAIVGVVAIHVIGILYLSSVGAIRHETVPLIIGWSIVLSGTKLLYDVFFSIIALFIAKYAKRLLWLGMD